MRLVARCTLAWLCLSLANPPALADEHDRPEQVARDLLTVITMEGRPCGEVTRTQRHGAGDYTATCTTGDQYRVRIVDARVRVEKL